MASARLKVSSPTARSYLGTREQGEIAFDNGCNRRLRATTSVVSSSSAFSRVRHHDGNGGLEFADRVGVTSGAHQPDGQRSARRCRVEMVFADAADLPLHNCSAAVMPASSWPDA